MYRKYECGQVHTCNSIIVCSVQHARLPYSLSLTSILNFTPNAHVAKRVYSNRPIFCGSFNTQLVSRVFIFLPLFSFCYSTLFLSVFAILLCFLFSLLHFIHLFLLRYFLLFRTLTSKRIEKKINSGNFFVACCPDKHVLQIAGKTDEKKRLKRCL